MEDRITRAALELRKLLFEALRMEEFDYRPLSASAYEPHPITLVLDPKYLRRLKSGAREAGDPGILAFRINRLLQTHPDIIEKIQQEDDRFLGKKEGFYLEHPEGFYDLPEEVKRRRYEHLVATFPTLASKIRRYIPQKRTKLKVIDPKEFFKKKAPGEARPTEVLDKSVEALLSKLEANAKRTLAGVLSPKAKEAIVIKALIKSIITSDPKTPVGKINKEQLLLYCLNKGYSIDDRTLTKLWNDIAAQLAPEKEVLETKPVTKVEPVLKNPLLEKKLRSILQQAWDRAVGRVPKVFSESVRSRQILTYFLTDLKALARGHPVEAVRTLTSEFLTSKGYKDVEESLDKFFPKT